MRDTARPPADRVRIAVQKSGRLAEDSLALLRNCGLHVDRSKDQLFCRIKELPIDLLLVRDDDIPGFVSSGICDLGIVGENVFAELQEAGNGSFGAAILERLGFSLCRLAIAAPEDAGVNTVSDLDGATIATSYPHLLKRFLRANGLAARTLLMTGSVEVAPRLRIADAVCDIVASGATLAANGLRELAVVLRSEALLIRSAQQLSAQKEETAHRLLERMRGALLAQDSKYIMLNAPRSAVDRIARLLPGCDAPTIMDLNRQNMVAIHAVCKETVFWETMEQIRAAGGTAILVLPIEKMLS
ncbi:MAG TPA: ATP phosphoribosyltransferase [Rhizomicrobium sp.]|nr:ATP phosphoribosyltransferase [Rhizomicrobium sp.]